MPLTTAVAGQKIKSADYNANFALAILTDTSRTVTVSHTWTASQSLTVASGQTLTLTGASVAGAPTWGSTQTLNTSGNAATATALLNARTLWGVSFDGSANVTALPTFGAGATVSNGQILTLTGATVTGLTAASVGAGTFAAGAFVFPSTVTIGAAANPVQVGRLSDGTSYGAISFNGSLTTTGIMGIFGRIGTTEGVYFNTPTSTVFQFTTNGVNDVKFNAGAVSGVTTLSASGSTTIGVGGSGSTQADLILSGSSNAGFGPLVRLRRNGVEKGFFGTESAVIGNNSDDVALYSQGNLKFYTSNSATAAITASSTTLTVALATTAVQALTAAGLLTANLGLTVTSAPVALQNPTLTLGTGAGNSGSILNMLGWGGGNKNWQISTANIGAGVGLSFTPSTAGGGSTFTTAVATISEAGALLLSAGISATTASFSNALTYGGVTLSNAVTGTGNMVLSASPTFTGTAVAAALTLSSLLNISGAAAGQIKFPATQNASADANTLDDYEEGTWTPIDTSGAGLVFIGAAGNYVKIGRLVVATGGWTYPVTADGTSSQTGGLPFAPGENARGFIGSGQSATAKQCFGSSGTNFNLLTATSTLIANSVLSGGSYGVCLIYVV